MPVALAFSDADGPDEAFAALTRYRRAVRRPHPDHPRLPVIFNDYMNSLMGDPTTEKLLPLIDAAAEAGAEYFCIDAGWYDDEQRGWWDSVGDGHRRPPASPAAASSEVLDRIRERGMVPGLWLEPEVIGVRSPMAAPLPDEAFFRRDGVRVTEHGRHHLDLRHPAARAHLDEVVDRLVGEWGVGYLKLDHNIDPGSGTSTRRRQSPAPDCSATTAPTSTGSTGVLDRHPHLVLENCSSGGMRMDYALLSRLQLQSTSDQQNLLLYPPIAASAPAAVTPGAGRRLGLPAAGGLPRRGRLHLANALLGRIHLSGRLTGCRPADGPGPRAWPRTTTSAPTSRGRARWPLGLPAWTTRWLALGMRVPDGPTYLLVWHRHGDRAETALPVRHLAGAPRVGVRVLHPAAGTGQAAWQDADAAVAVRLPRTPTALLLRLDTTA